VRILDHPAASSDWRRADDLQCRRRVAHAVREHELGGFLDADASRSDSPIFQTLRHQRERTLVFLPHRDIGVLHRSAGELLARPVLFERWCHDVRIAGFRNDHGEKALAVTPADTGEVGKRRAPRQDDGVDLLFGHELSRFFQPAATLGGGDRLCLGAHRGQRLDAGRKRTRQRRAAAPALG
jgi:hypothetical protein